MNRAGRRRRDRSRRREPECGTVLLFQEGRPHRDEYGEPGRRAGGRYSAVALLRDTDNPKLVASAVEELLRYLNITHSGRRRVALEDIEIAGQIIRAGEGLIMANDLGNRDPEVFADPDRLDLQRDAHRHVAFSFGVHQCLGQSLARLELQVVYGTLYRRIPTLRRATDIQRIPFKHDGSVYGVYELPVTW